MSDPITSFLTLLESVLGQPVEWSPQGRAAFQSPEGATILVDKPEDEEGFMDRVHLFSEVAAPPAGSVFSLEILALALTFNRALLSSYGFTLILGNYADQLPQHLYLHYAGTASGLDRATLTALLQEFSNSAAYLKAELQPETTSNS